MRLSILTSPLAACIVLAGSALTPAIVPVVGGVGLLSLLPVSAVSAAAQEQGETLNKQDRDAIQAVINAQIDAFRKDDAASAFALNTPGIQTQFHDPETFMEVVRRGYAPVYRPQSVLFGPLMKLDEQWAQSVEILGPGGKLVEAIFVVERTGRDAVWAIGGCFLRPSKSTPA